LAILLRIANAKQKSACAIFLPHTAVGNGGMKTLRNNFKRQAEAKKNIYGNVYCWQRRRGTSAPLEEAA